MGSARVLGVREREDGGKVCCERDFAEASALGSSL